MKITREWAMPNSRTFRIFPIAKLIEKYIRMAGNDAVIVDPFANNSKYGTITNDIDPDTETDFHMEATDFLQKIPSKSVDIVLYDPPFSVRQLSECYKKYGLSVTMQDTTPLYWTKQKAIIGKIVKPSGYVISFGWNSGGIGLKNGFDIVEILMVNHGGIHNDTICTVEQKRNELKLFDTESFEVEK